MEKSGKMDGKRDKMEKGGKFTWLAGTSCKLSPQSCSVQLAGTRTYFHMKPILPRFFMTPFFKYLWQGHLKSLKAHLHPGHPGTHPATQGVCEGEDGQGSVRLRKNWNHKGCGPIPNFLFFYKVSKAGGGRRGVIPVYKKL